MRKLFKTINPELLPKLGYSRYEYSLPLDMDRYFIYPRSPEHTGRFKHAVDIQVPNPEKVETIIHAPATGIIEFAVTHNVSWGPTKEFVGLLNYVNIRIPNTREFYELAHIAPLDGLMLHPGIRVEKGEPIAKAGLNGRMTTTNGRPDSHLHIMVGEWADSQRSDFRSLKIRWDNKVKFIDAY